ncbi:hypothetical protein TVAG_169450 [Trichomonas vaginalis G3]|uniref:Glycosyltransferase 61 catalytic domain-containing protein n=1 Tax=Trichomonas vaginalis (strain ATCC PRA-98 / G3) TaxID=412133 RepID=A2G6A1_TRIV3|nr:protein of unknown function, DUF563 family [Trichomonas vaginalis G3]EAX87312.1 hypothetical protein TVAG_169450 [Trichomonas vaginalis G3]KAI5522808.1 protein of unknown function, DUF563 family [Trichomonas vaginalis G3]|eukprot:XP_001300242.1 hypothetical protein [Trichomonas vaginalis G3]
MRTENKPTIYETIWTSKKCLAFISLVIVLFCFWNFGTELLFKVNPARDSFEIGYGTMFARDSVNQLREGFKIPMNPMNFSLNKYQPPIFFKSIYPSGYIPGENDVKLLEPMLLVFRNSVFTPESVIVKWNGFHVMSLVCHPRFWNASYSKFYNINFITYYKYHSAVCIGHQHTSDFGHWFLEVLPCFFAVPQWILDTSVIVVPHYKKYIVEHLSLFNITEDKIIFAEDTYLYAENLYMMHSNWCGDINQLLIQNMKQKFIEMFKLNREKPSKYVLYNRFNMSREIGNWQEVLDAIRTQHPEYKWEVGYNLITLAEQAKYFNSIRVFFAVHGSVLSNIIFMQKGTSVVELQMEKWLLSFIYLGGFTEVNMIEGRDASIMHIPVQKTNVDALYISRLITKAIEKLEN